MLHETSIWTGKRVFLTGHTGFKGGWLALWLSQLGANVRGYSLDPESRPNLFEAADIGSRVEDIRGDICDAAKLESALVEFAPEVIFHLAAQPLVRASYLDPIKTYETNVLGTAHVLEAARRLSSVRAIVCVTTDKCYENREWVWGYRETDPLGGYDPYSSSKACAEIVAAAFRQSFFPIERFSEHRVAIATARAGNVVGGGDWSTDRLIPDLIRSFIAGKPARIRSPRAIRPWQHVLEPLHGYLLLAEKLLGKDANNYAKAYNFGPAESDNRPVSWIAECMTKMWGEEASWISDEDVSLHEAHYLKLDANRARHELGWESSLGLTNALDWLVRWHKSQLEGGDMQAFTVLQIEEYTETVIRRFT
jgi:CDP-glucose 4,6-dehydratase